MFVASSYCKLGEVIVHAYQESDMVVCCSFHGYVQVPLESFL